MKTTTLPDQPDAKSPAGADIRFLMDGKSAGGELALEENEIVDAGWFAADTLPSVPPKMSIARRLIDWFVAEGSA